MGMTRTTRAPGGPPASEDQSILCPICRKTNVRRARFCQHCGHETLLDAGGAQYVITRVIKQGGQGAVYEVIDQRGRAYALKELLDRAVSPDSRAEAAARFRAEAALLERLAHPGIPRVYAHFEEDGRHYLAMELVAGEDLEQVLERERALPEARVLALAEQICRVLGYLHAQRPPIIFRDMKPSNVLIARDGSVKIVDFGIAKLFQPTERGPQIGTPGYAPPEQYQGLATVESDIYALGATLHHALTGRDPRDEPPFSFPPVRQLAPRVSQRTADAIEQALHMDPRERFQSISALQAALRPLPPAHPPRRPVPPLQPAQAMPLPARPAGPTPPIQRAVPPTRATRARTRRPWPARVASAIGRALGALVRLVVTFVVLLALAAAALWYFAPETVSQYLPALDISQPTAVPTLTARIGTPFAVNVEVTTAADASEEQVRQAFVGALTAAVQAEYGATTHVNVDTFTYLSGAPEAVQAADGKITYRAAVQALVQTSAP